MGRLTLLVHVANGPGPNLLGRDWLRELGVSVEFVNNLADHAPALQVILDDHAEVFENTLGCFNQCNTLWNYK